MKFEIEKLEHFVVIPNDHLMDKNLTLKAKGLLSTMYSLPNDWDYSIQGLCRITNTGITAIRNIIAELELRGYLTRKQTRNTKGQWEYTYIVRIKKINTSYKNCLSLKRFKTANNLK